jgi:hypothetical protein
VSILVGRFDPVAVAAALRGGRVGDAVSTLRRTIESGSSLASKQPWSALVTVTSLTAEGSQVTAVVAASRPGLGSRVVEARDALFDVG